MSILILELFRRAVRPRGRTKQRGRALIFKLNRQGQKRTAMQSKRVRGVLRCEEKESESATHREEGTQYVNITLQAQENTIKRQPSPLADFIIDEEFHCSSGCGPESKHDSRHPLLTCVSWGLFQAGFSRGRWLELVLS